MLTLPSSVRIWLCTGAVDLRKGFDGLAAIVRNQWRMDVFVGHLFVFLGMRRDRCKILLWEPGGMAIYFKRLEKGRFRIPDRLDDVSHVEIDATALTMLLDGIDFGRLRRADHWKPPEKST